MPDPNHLLVHGVAFLLPCRAGNTTIKRAIAHALLNRDPTPLRATGSPDAAINIHHLQHFDYSSIPEILAARPHRIVGLIRDPIARARSQYNYLAPASMSLTDWLRVMAATPDPLANLHARSQAWDLLHEGRPLPTDWLRTDQLEADWRRLAEDEGWPVHPFDAYWNSLEDHQIARRPCPELDDPDSEASLLRRARYLTDDLLWWGVSRLAASSRLSVLH